MYISELSYWNYRCKTAICANVFLHNEIEFNTFLIYFGKHKITQINNAVPAIIAPGKYSFLLF